MSTDDSDQVVQRRANLEELKALGVDAYPRRFDAAVAVSTLVAEAMSHLSAMRLLLQSPTHSSGMPLGVHADGPPKSKLPPPRRLWSG